MKTQLESLILIRERGELIVVTNINEWNNGLNYISNRGNNKRYTIAVNGDVGIPGTYDNSFGSVTNLSLTISGEGKLYLTSPGSIIRLTDNQTLNIDNFVMEGLRVGQNGASQDNNIAAVYVSGSNARVELRNGSIRGNTSDSADGGVYVTNHGTFTMRDNAAVYDNIGDGVYVHDGGTFTMQNSAAVYGNNGGVFVDGGTFTMQDNAKVYGNNSHGVNLNGGAFTMNGNTTVYDNNDGVSVSGGTFNMQSSAAVYGNNSHGITLNSGAFTMNGNTTVYNNNGGVSVSGGTFNMQSSAAVYGNNSHGITLDGGTFNMQDSAKVYGNNSYGITLNGGAFTMNGNTTVYDNNGGVSLGDGTFTMQGSAAVYGNNSHGITLNGGAFTMNGNTAVYDNNGGVYASGGTFTMRGSASVYGNTVSNGGGVYVEGGNFTMMENSSVHGNTASNNGGGVYVGFGTLTMHDSASIYNNTAYSGGGVYVNGIARIAGGIIYGNAEGVMNNTAVYGASLFREIYGTAEYGTFSGDSFILTGSLDTTGETIVVQNGKLVQLVSITHYWINDNDEITVSAGTTTIYPGQNLIISPNDSGFTVHSWSVNGIRDTGQNDTTYTFYSAGRAANVSYIITLVVEKNGKYYSADFVVRIEG